MVNSHRLDGMNKKYEVMIIGRVNLDYLNIIDRYPEEDSKVMIKERLIETGGQGSNNSTCIAKLRGSHLLVSRTGDDKEGKFCLKRLAESGVDTEFVEVIPNGRTPVSFVFIARTSGRRTIMYDPETLPPFQLTEKIRSNIQSSKTLLIDPSATYLAKELVELPQRPPVIYDCERFREGIEQMMKIADYFAPSSDFLDDEKLALEADSFIGKIKELSRQISGRLIVTAAQDGAFFINDGGTYQVKPPETEIKDTTGAGDVFHGALALALSRKFPLDDAVKFSVATATLSCRGYGGRIAVPGWDEAIKVSERLKMVRI